MILDAEQSRRRSQFFMAQPALWPLYPFLPLVRRHAGPEPDLGVLYDAWGQSNVPGYSATVFLHNVQIGRAHV